jgi:acyl carrier protein
MASLEHRSNELTLRFADTGVALRCNVPTNVATLSANFQHRGLAAAKEQGGSVKQSSDRELARVLDTVRHALEQVIERPLNDKPASAALSLVEDLGIDSLKFVDLTVALEDAFELDEFPMQAWVDREAHKEAPRFTVLALARACLDQLERKRRAVAQSPSVAKV